ncbi:MULTISPECIES: hypothetical protein [Streptomyces rochei group]|uniref:hypothetical protein n=1 Tax=Streptomyces rochei group TaxID=2867164 RepID=UPI001874D363|nr:hypothetical protein [Streptomyces vinaceusdrappus]GHC26947.1 hypothetical protein GCM10010308_49800 [Streptomyces vinaceusdrappus]
MDESTQTEAGQGTPGAYGFCSWHQRFSEGIRLINLTPEGADGKVHYACPQCVHIFKLTPYADET